MKDNEFNYDDIENLLLKLNENKDLIDAILKMLEKLKGAGAVESINHITDVLPDNLDFFVRSFTSPDFTDVISKSGNTLISLLFLLSNNEMADVIKAISFNSQGIAESMIDNASSAQPMSIFKLLSLFKDPEVSSGLNALIGALKVLGKSLKTLK